MHPRDAAGHESLLPATIAPALAAIRAAAPGMPVGVSTGAWIEPDRDRLLAQVRVWAQLPQDGRPDYASVNCESAAGNAELVAALAETTYSARAARRRPAP